MHKSYDGDDMQAAITNWRKRLINLIENPAANRFIITLILINAVTLGASSARA